MRDALLDFREGDGDYRGALFMISVPSSLSAGHPKAARAAAVALFAAIAASVILGPQLAVWPSGPALLLLAAACVLVLPIPVRLPWSVALAGLALVAWLVARGLASPVAEFAVADGVLLASCVAVFWVVRAVLPTRGGLEILFTGLGLLVFANWWPMWLQSRDPSHVLWLPRGTEGFPSGFFGYYGDCAAFLTGMALLAGGLVWDHRRARWFRVFMGIVALAAAAGVIFTKARGGILGLGAGGLLLLVLAPWLTLRRGSRWLGVLALGLPLILIGGLLGLGHGLSEAQQARGAADGGGLLLDNAARLFWLSLAGSCIAGHPWQGGGSRSFSWENFQFWDAGWVKFSDAEPEFVHNELLQMASDYGIAGLVLLVLFVGAIMVTAIVARWNGAEAKDATAAFLAGVAALTGLLFHSCFHFVFHVPPAALLLGLALAATLETTRNRIPSRSWRASAMISLVPAGCTAALGFFGIKACAVFREMGPLVYRVGQAAPELAEAITRVEAAIGIWPGPGLYKVLGRLSQQAAASVSGAERQRLFEKAEGAFRQSRTLHPFDPESSVNLANVLSALERDAEAEEEFARAIQLQGGLERGFRARFSASLHFFRKAERLRQSGKREDALASLIQARDLFDQESSPSAWEFGTEGRTFRIGLCQWLGPWLEALGRHEEAAAEYQRAGQIPGAESIHYLAGRNLTAWGDRVWLERRPESALRMFHEARRQVNQARQIRPLGYPAGELDELARRISTKISFLEGAGIRAEDAPPGPP
jgi:tetratricopeptide (TPR) repeat protein/O-antigen ligase